MLQMDELIDMPKALVWINCSMSSVRHGNRTLQHINFLYINEDLRWSTKKFRYVCNENVYFRLLLTMHIASRGKENVYQGDLKSSCRNKGYIIVVTLTFPANQMVNWCQLSAGKPFFGQFFGVRWEVVDTFETSLKEYHEQL